ncbi:hypothetical protein BH11PAT4_BH11PAT4_4830 [soil metagenome]
MSYDPQVFNPDEAEVHFPFVPFVVSVVVNTAAAALLYYLIAREVFIGEMSTSWLVVLMWMAVIGLPLSLFEYLYHRYLLHSAVFPFMKSMNRSHDHHHELTDVKPDFKPTAVGEDGLYPVESKYPIESEAQEESMHFPLYSLIIFQAVFGILLALPLKLMFPGAPVLLGTLLTVTVYFVSYEVWHMIQHLPYTKFWVPRLYQSRFKKAWQRVYVFHLMHHYMTNVNMAVVGYYGIALWDHVFNTCYRMEELPVKGARVALGSLKYKPTPRWPVRLVDSWKGPMYKWSRKVEAWGRRLLRIKEQAR